MKSHLLILSALMILVFASGCAEEKLLENYKTFAIGSAQVKYPENWEAKNTPGNDKSFFSPLESGDVFQESVSIKLMDASGKTLDETLQQIVSDLEEGGVTVTIANSKINEMDARDLIYTLKARIEDKEIYVRNLQRFAIKDNVLYLFTYSAEQFDKYYLTANAIMNSLEISI